MLKILFSVASGLYQTARLSILIYHRVLPNFDPFRSLEITKSEFIWQMNLVAKNFNAYTLSEAINRLHSGCLPSRSICITFDDGYADNYEIALPILQYFKIPATFFIASGFLDGGRMWNDSVIEIIRVCRDGVLNLSDHSLGIHAIKSTETRRKAVREILSKAKYLPPDERKRAVASIVDWADSKLKLPGNLMMTSEQVQGMHKAGMEIGAHTVNHPILERISVEESESEIKSSREQLEALVGQQQVKVFAYPNGQPEKDYRQADVEVVRKLGFDAAVSTKWGVSTTDTDRWQLPRFTPWDKTPSRFMLRLLRNYWF